MTASASAAAAVCTFLSHAIEPGGRAIETTRRAGAEEFGQGHL